MRTLSPEHQLALRSLIPTYPLDRVAFIPVSHPIPLAFTKRILHLHPLDYAMLGTRHGAERSVYIHVIVSSDRRVQVHENSLSNVTACAISFVYK